MCNSGPQEPAAVYPECIRSLLIAMLVRVRHSRETPLYFGVDGHRVARAALDEVGMEELSGLGLTEVLCGIDGFVREVLELPRSRGHGPVVEGLQAGLGQWMLATHGRLRSVHPMALDILGLLVEGQSEREIAVRLDFGLRLVRRIVADMRLAW